MEAFSVYHIYFNIINVAEFSKNHICLKIIADAEFSEFTVNLIMTIEFTISIPI